VKYYRLQCCRERNILGYTHDYNVGFVAAAVSMPMGGCRARRTGDDVSLMSAGTVAVIVAAEPAVL